MSDLIKILKYWMWEQHPYLIHENLIFYQYRWKNNITGFSNQNCNILKKKFKSNKFIKGDAKNIKLKKNTFDISFCSATIEHVGSYANQKKLVSP